jgi:hexulose-6-phosphate isomerase
LTSTGREQILSLIEEFQVHVPSVTCDYYMENPHWKANPVEVSKSLRSVLHGMSLIGSRVLVIPLVDNSSIRETHDFDWQYFLGFEETLIETQTQIAFEVDLPPNDAAAFMSNFNPELFGINYDIGNSASLGYDPREEIDLFGDRIFNVHVKDRLLGAQTVPLGQGNANFRQVFDALKSVDYRRNYILQTARSSDGKHFDVLLEYKIFLESILSK